MLSHAVPSERAPSGTRAFFRAVGEGDERAVCAMLKAGVDPDQLDGRGASALGTALEQGLGALAHLLLKGGADPDMADTQEGVSAMMLAVQAADTASVRAMNGFGADVNCPAGVWGRTALFSALGIRCFESAHAIVATLVSCGADLNHRDTQGWTALMAGIVEFAPTAALLPLLRFGADASVRASGGLFYGKDNGSVGNHFVTNDTALTLAVRCNRLDMVEALLRAGVEPEQCAIVDGVERVSALMIAAKTGNLPIFYMLLDHGANAAHEDSTLRTALCYVEEYRKEQLRFEGEQEEEGEEADGTPDANWELVHGAMLQRIAPLRLVGVQVPPRRTEALVGEPRDAKRARRR